ncbi:MAG: hypothetical protein R6V53_06860 [Candidatus Woesearchaeota archaeon]
MNRLALLGIILCVMPVAFAYPSYIDITMAETVYQNITFAKDFDPVENQTCIIIGVINVTNLNDTHAFSDILVNLTNVDSLETNITHVSGRNGTSFLNKTNNTAWLHIPELRGNNNSVWNYTLDCADTQPPLNIDTSYETSVDGVNLKVLAGKNFTVTSIAENSAGFADITNLNITIEAQQVTWNESTYNFSLVNLFPSGDYTNVSGNDSKVQWIWRPMGGTLPIGEKVNITYNVSAPISVPTSNTYLAIKETSEYSIAYMASNISIESIKAVGDLDFGQEKAIIRPATNVNDTNVTWRIDADTTVPLDAAYNITRVSVWVTHNLSPMATDTPFGHLNTTYSPSGLQNKTNGWQTTSSGSERYWTFNYTDGSDPITSPPPVVWIRPYHHLFDGKNQIIKTNITQSGEDVYLKYIYVVNGYWLEIDKNITSIDEDMYQIDTVVSNIGNGWTPQDLKVTAYDFVPSEFAAWDFSEPYNLESTLSGAGGYNGTSYRWDIPQKSGFNASLGPCTGPNAVSQANCTWNVSYKVNGSGQYRVSELYIVGLDPQKVEGAPSHEGITVISSLANSTKESLYALGALALIALNVVNFVMTRRINKKLNN